MKTLIFNGSPRKYGDTEILIKEFTEHIDGEYKVVDAFECNIKPCNDCRFCWNHDGCIQIDEMNDVYDYIQECDNILIASPIFFTELTGQLLAVTSRLQTYFCAKYLRNEIPIKKSKKGGIILAQGGTHQTEKAADTALILLKAMNAVDFAPVLYCLDTDNILPKNNPQAMKSAKEIAAFFNKK